VVERRNALALIAPTGRPAVENPMKIVLLGLIGLFFGAMLGGAVGVGLGLVWTQVFNTSCFEGYCGMLVFFTFMPIGALVGGLAGAFALGRAAARDREVGGAG
jgi:hypothetical protein